LLGNVDVLKIGRDISLIAVDSVVHEAYFAALELEKESINAGVLKVIGCYNLSLADRPPNVVNVEAIKEILPLNLGCSERLRWQLHLPTTTPGTPSEKHSYLEAQRTPSRHAHPPEQAGSQIKRLHEVWIQPRRRSADLHKMLQDLFNLLQISDHSNHIHG